MDTSTGIVPTMPIGGSEGFGSNSGIWLFAILALFFFGGAGGGWGNASSRAATVEDLNNSANFTRLESQVSANGAATERKTDAIINGLSSLGYEMSNRFAETNANVTAQVQSVKDMIQENTIQSLRDQLGQVQLAQALAGVVRYPSATTYAVPSPCFSSGTNI